MALDAQSLRFQPKTPTPQLVLMQQHRRCPRCLRTRTMNTDPLCLRQHRTQTWQRRWVMSVQHRPCPPQKQGLSLGWLCSATLRACSSSSHENATVTNCGATKKTVLSSYGWVLAHQLHRIGGDGSGTRSCSEAEAIARGPAPATSFGDETKGSGNKEKFTGRRPGCIFEGITRLGQLCQSQSGTVRSREVSAR